MHTLPPPPLAMDFLIASEMDEKSLDMTDVSHTLRLLLYYYCTMYYVHCMDPYRSLGTDPMVVGESPER